jgi:hypothetical protein
MNQSVRVSFAILALSMITAVASAQQLTVNGTTPPGTLTIGAGSAATVVVSNGPGNATDWIGLYAGGAADSGPLDWRYLSGTTAPPATGVSAATLTWPMPVTPGDYELRLFVNNTYQRIATSAVITVTAATTELTINGTPPPATATVFLGTTVSVGITNGPGNATDWVALAAAGAADTSYVDWRYLNGATTPPSAGVSSATVAFQTPAVPGAYEVRYYVNGSFQRLATSGPLVVTPSAAQLTVNGLAAPAALTVSAGSTVAIAVSNGPANAADWVGLFAAGAADALPLAWQYLNGSTAPPASGVAAASLAFLVPASPGSYEVRFFSNNGYTRLATSGAVLVDASPAQLVVNGVVPPDGAVVAAGSSVAVTVSAGPANPTDWMTLALAGSPDTSYVDWRYLSGTTVPPASGLSAATVPFTAPVAAGTYEARLFAGNTYERLATSGPITVTPPAATLAINGVVPPTPVSVTAGTTISLQIAGGPGNTTDWIALAPSGSPMSTYVAWQYLNGLLTPPPSALAGATLTFLAPTTPGTYEFRFFAAGGYSLLASAALTVVPSSATIVVNGVGAPGTVSVAVGDTLTAAIANGPGNSTDWVALAAVGAPESSYLTWRYLTGSTAPPTQGLNAATLTFAAPAEGLYEIRLYANNTFTRIATSASITVVPTVSTAIVLTSPAPNTTATLPVSIPVHAEVTSTVTIASVNVYADAQLIGSSTTAPFDVTWVPSAAGAYALTAVATDTVGRVTTSAGVPITVVAVSDPNAPIVINPGDQTNMVTAPYGYAQTVLADQAVGYWRLDADGQATVTDWAVTPHPGATSGGVEFGAAGALSDGSTAMAFDGAAGTAIAITSNPALDVSTSFSIEAWANPASVSGTGVVFSRYVDTAGTAYQLVQRDGNWVFEVNGAWGSANAAMPVNAEDVGTWTHLAGTFNGQWLLLYRNGVPWAIGFASFADPVPVWTGEGPASIGTGFVGALDEIAFYPSELAPEQVANHYALRTAMASVSVPLVASDPNHEALTYSATGLPSGLELNPYTGVITGNPMVIGTYPVTVTATNPSGHHATQAFTWTIIDNHGTLEPPTIAPPSGSYTDSAEITLSSVEGATIRYTLDGSDPTAESAVYTAPFPVTTNATVKARAWAPNYFTSGVGTADYVIVPAAPTALPAGGTFDRVQHVTLTAAAGADIRYTLDGTDPDQTSPPYSVPIPVGFGVTVLKARAYTGNGRVSDVSTNAYLVQTDRPAPMIVATVSPTPNPAGWNTSPVTVSFTCAGEGTVMCSDPVTVDRDGVQDVAGTVTDDIGQAVMTAVTVRLDRRAPLITITAPRPNAVVSVGTVTIVGNAVDALGATTVTCDGIAATMDSDRFTCEVTVPASGITTQIIATDEAGNASTRALAIVTDISMGVAASELRLTPQTITMAVGQTRRLSLLDDLGRAPSNATWMVSDSAVATIDASSTVHLTAVAAGAVTVTATWQGLTASTDVQVLAPDSIVAGTTLWSAPPIGGSVDKIVQGAPGPDGSRQIYALEGTMLRALSTDGAEVWAQDVGTVTQLSGDPLGGAVAFVNTGTQDVPTYVLRHFDADGRMAEQAVPKASRGWKDAFAISPDGPLYLVDCESGACSLVGKDIGFGGGVTVPLPTGTLTTCTDGSAEAPTGCTAVQTSFGAGTPTIMEDGRVAVPVVTGGDQVFIDPVDSHMERVYAPTMSVVFVNPATGQQTVQVIPGASLALPDLDQVWPDKVIPNGEGGVFVTWTGRYRTDTQRFGANIAALSADGTPSGGETIGEMWGDLVVGENGVALASTYLGGHQRMVTPVGPGGYSIGSPSFYDTDVDVTSIVAEHGGSFVTSFSRRPMLGSDDGYDAMSLAYASYVGDGVWIGAASGATSSSMSMRSVALPIDGIGIVAMFGPSLTIAVAPWSYFDADSKATNAAAPSSIKVYCRAVGQTDAAYVGAQHCYILTKGDDGVFTIEGGEQDGHPQGTLRVNALPGVPDPYNHPDRDLAYYSSSDANVPRDIACLKSTAAVIDQWRLPYFFLGPNSNSTVVELMMICGSRSVLLPPTAFGRDVRLRPR